MARMLSSAVFALAMSFGAAHSVPVSIPAVSDLDALQPTSCDRALTGRECGPAVGSGRASGLIHDVADAGGIGARSSDRQFMSAEDRGNAAGGDAGAQPFDMRATGSPATGFFAGLPAPLCVTPLCVGPVISALPARPEGIVLALGLGCLAALGAIGIRPST